MILTRLQVRQLRCLAEAEWRPGAGLNVVVGPNGAGKSSLVEALHLLAYGRSFRGRVSDGLIRSGQPHLEVYAEWVDASGSAHRAGLRHAGSRWEARLDGGPVPSLSELCARFAMVTFEPGSHDLIGGGAEHRRRFLDWGLFHVEPDFLPVWRRYNRALKQRNALLKSAPGGRQLDPWDAELAEAGERLTRLREQYLLELEPLLVGETDAFIPELGASRLEFRPGWKRDDLPLADALLLGRERDLATGHTGTGPANRRNPRASRRDAGREALSRGQEKLTALACILAQGRSLAVEQGHWPLVALDDLASELDAAHQSQVLAAVLASGAQVLLTGTHPPAELPEAALSTTRMFHVERGVIEAR